MRPAEEINNLIKKLNIKASANLDKRVRESISGDKAEFQKALSSFQNSFMRRIIMKNIMIKLAAATMLIVLCAFLFIFIFNSSEPENKINIPSELASMDVKELIKLYYDPAGSAYDPNMIKIALQQAMDKTSPDAIVKIAKNLAGFNNPTSAGRGMGRGMMQRIEYANPVGGFLTRNGSFTDTIEGTDIFVNARFIGTKITNADDIVQSIIDKMSYSLFDFSSKFRVSIKMEVIDTLPEGSLEKGKIIELKETLYEQQMDQLQEGSQYYFPIVQTDIGLRLLSYVNGVYQVDTNDEAGQSDMLWKFYSDAQDVLLFGNKPQQETINYWASYINSDFTDLAFAYMDLVPDELLPAREIVDLIESRQDEVLSQIEPDMDFYELRDTRIKLRRIERPLKIAIRSDDQGSLERLANVLIKEDSFLEIMDFLPDNLIPTPIIMDAIERKYQYVISEVEKVLNYNPRNFPQGDDLLDLSTKAISFMLSSGDRDSMKRMLSLYESDMEKKRDGHLFRTIAYFKKDFVNNLVRLIIGLEDDIQGDQLLEAFEKYKDVPIVFETYFNYNGSFTSNPQKAQRDYAHGIIMEIINQSAKFANETIYSMLSKILEDPTAYTINDAKSYAKIWSILGTSESFEMGSYLGDFLKMPNLSGISYEPMATWPEDRPDAQFDFEVAAFGVLQLLPEAQKPTHKEMINLLIQIYERSKNNPDRANFVAETFNLILRNDDTECVPVLAEMLRSNNPPRDIVKIISRRMPDPGLVPAIKEALEKKFDFSLIDLLYTCGDEETAIDYAMELFGNPIRENNTVTFGGDLDLTSNIMLLIGKSGKTNLISGIELYTDEEVIKNLQKNTLSNNRFNMNKRFIRKLQANAMMALARLKGKDSIAQLRRNYETSKDIDVKLAAAISLYYLGDDTGLEILRPIVNNTCMQVPEIAIKLGVDLSIEEVFQNPIVTYLRSERTDTLLLEQISNYVSSSDDSAIIEWAASDYFSEETYSWHRTPFCLEYSDQIMNMLVEHLNNRSSEVRSSAQSFLTRLTGQNFGFDPKKYHGRQDDIIQKWRDYIAKEYPSTDL